MIGAVEIRGRCGARRALDQERLTVVVSSYVDTSRTGLLTRSPRGPARVRTRSSSAADSAASPRRSGSSRAAIGSPCSRSSTVPAGGLTSFRQDGFTFDAGPTIVTAPFLFEELWALCGRRMADDVDLRPIDPFYDIRFPDGAAFA